MMTRLAILIMMLLPIAALGQQAPVRAPAKITFYKTADSAACSGDVAVWLDPDRHVFYLKGDRLFGKTGRGGYNCRRQAEAAGYQRGKP